MTHRVYEDKIISLHETLEFNKLGDLCINKSFLKDITSYASSMGIRI